MTKIKPLAFGALPSYEALVKEHGETRRKLKNAMAWIEGLMGAELMLKIVQDGYVQPKGDK